MFTRLLHLLGLLALITLVAGSFAALAIVKQRIHVTFAAEEAAAARGPDPIATLAADLAEVRGDLRALAEGSARHLQELDEALDAAATDRDVATRAAFTTALDRLGARFDTAFARVDRDLERISAALAERERPAPPKEPTTEPVVVAAPIEEAPPAPPEPAPAPTPTKKKSFLRFELPSEGFAFDRRQRFAIVPSLSRVGFDAKSTLHDFSGVTSKIEGELTTNPAHADQNCSGTLSVAAATLDTGLAERDAEMRADLATDAHPQITFAWTAFVADSVDAAGMKVAGNVTGMLTIHGTERPVTMPVKVTVDASRRLVIEGQTSVKLPDFGVTVPKALGVISVDETVTIWIALRARSLGAATEAPHAK